MKKLFRTAGFLVLAGVFLASCSTADLYEKTATIPGHAWKSSYKPSFTFTIRDTTAAYDVSLVLRHADKYKFNNIWLNLTIQAPGNAAPVSIHLDKKLATNETGWLGSGMDDIYEHRISLVPDLVENNISFRKPGEYTFTLEQIMREDPLDHVLNAGIRIEKKH